MFALQLVSACMQSDCDLVCMVIANYRLRNLIVGTVSRKSSYVLISSRHKFSPKSYNNKYRLHTASIGVLYNLYCLLQ